MDSRLSSTPERMAVRVVVAFATNNAAVAAAGIACALAASSAATYAAGGTRTAMPHLVYVPIAMAAARFRALGALVVAMAAGLLLGPMMPLDVAAGTVQPVYGWLTRLFFFVLVGQTVAVLCHRSLTSLSEALTDLRAKAQLEVALARSEFKVVYQPLVELETGRIVGVEALVRWEHPRRGEVPPDMFIGAAERTGVIVDIGLYVLREASSQVARWRATIAAASELKIAVNLSARQLDDDNLPNKVAAVLAETGLPPGALQLEVTETAVITDVAAATSQVQELRNLGIAIAVDDFGTGESSLAYLHRFRADVIKIDRVFVQALDDHDQARALAAGVIGLAASLGATTVAEGIETAAQAEAVRALGCRIGQGYHFARPSGPDQIERLLTRAGRRNPRNKRGSEQAPFVPWAKPSFGTGHAPTSRVRGGD